MTTTDYDDPLFAADPRTRRMAALMKDAEAAGYKLEISGGTMHILKRHKGHGGILRGLTVYDDGSAFDIKVAPSVARSMRSYSDMREILGLPKEGALPPAPKKPSDARIHGHTLSLPVSIDWEPQMKRWSKTGEDLPAPSKVSSLATYRDRA